MMTYDYPKLEKLLKKAGQAHLLLGFETLSEKEKICFAEELSAIDFSIFERAAQLETKTYEHIAPMPIFSAEQAEKEKTELETIGLSAIREGKIGAVLLCGGQGTRLGSPHAKGMYNIGITKEISIFSLHFRYLSEVAKRAGRWFPIYIMTSVYNSEEIKTFLRDMLGL